MRCWSICGCSLLTVSLLIGCLPPVQEATDGNTPNVSSEAAEQTAAADNEPAAAEVPATSDGEFTKAASGLKYKVVREGGAKPKASDTVRVHYKGWLDDGTIFDQSYGGTPAEFPLGGVIAGWTEGLQYVGVGGEIELEIPSNLGYGPRGQGSIPPNATLHFKVELLEIL